MHSQFAPMSSHTVQFAKAYRAEQILTAEQSRLAAQFTTPRRSPGSRIRTAWTAMFSHIRHTRATTGADQPRPAH